MKTKYLLVLAGVIGLALLIFFVGYTSVLNNKSTDASIVKTSSKITAFSATDIDGNEYASSTHRDITVYEVFASWCLPCREGVPDSQEFADKHKNVDLVGIAYRDVIPEINKFEKEYGKFETTIKTTGKIENNLGLRSIPQTLFVVDGVVHYRIYGTASPDDLENVLSLVEGELASS